MLPAVENKKAPELMGVLGDAHRYIISSVFRCVRVSVGSLAERWIFGKERTNDSMFARICKVINYYWLSQQLYAMGDA